MADFGRRTMEGQGRPLVAVVTPVYNGAEFLEKIALPSVAAQTYRPLVHVLLDNASTDATPEIMARYIADSGVPVIHARNEKTISQVENFNAAVQLVPAEAAYFTMLCADDMMKPTAMEDMMGLAARHPGLALVGALESVNECVRPSFLPEDVSVFDAMNTVARVLADDARPPFPHVLYRRDFLRAGEDFFSAEFTAFDVEVALRLLSKGGHFGFVHKHLFNNLHHEAALTATVAKKKLPYLWEQLLLIERFGPAALTNTDYRRVRKRHLRTVYRRFLWWMLAGPRENLTRDLARFESRGLKPGFGDYLDAALTWPGHVAEKRFAKPNRPFAWPSDAYRPGTALRRARETA